MQKFLHYLVSFVLSRSEVLLSSVCSGGALSRVCAVRSRSAVLLSSVCLSVSRWRLFAAICRASFLLLSLSSCFSCCRCLRFLSLANLFLRSFTHVLVLPNMAVFLLLENTWHVTGCQLLANDMIITSQNLYWLAANVDHWATSYILGPPWPIDLKVSTSYSKVRIKPRSKRNRT